MSFELDASGIKIKFEVLNFHSWTEENRNEEWCECGYRFFTPGRLNCYKDHDAIMECAEVEELEQALTALLEDRISEPQEIGFVEPDLVFELYPKKDKRDDPQYLYVKPGHEIQDIYLEWRVYFWNRGLTKNYLSVTLYRSEIEDLRNYL